MRIEDLYAAVLCTHSESEPIPVFAGDLVEEVDMDHAAVLKGIQACEETQTFGHEQTPGRFHHLLCTSDVIVHLNILTGQTSGKESGS
ncbi:hypothetical protein [Catellatospora chokoriensis]|uniref:Uncharacterized protein n=1 Tax=Catellatospora chokoriensis TaxID=310353 RepID=A0A8J3NRK1_9ACTN|nr:hypothetical protein [Catellatospora chokoriensis]GIF89488.1 hypothetical protein Cch02nite_29320 [Catellatospora chokoriensis]